MKEVGEKLVNRCNFHADWKDLFHTRNMEKRPHVGPELAQYEPSSESSKFRERMADTMVLCQSNERVSVH